MRLGHEARARELPSAPYGPGAGSISKLTEEGTSPSRQAERPAANRLWRRLNVGWALYYVLTFTVGRYAEYQMAVIWLGGALIAGLTFLAMLRHRTSVPRSVWMLWGFVAWSFLGLAIAQERWSFWRALSLRVELAVVVSLIALCLGRARDVRVWYLAFLVAGVVSATSGEMREAAPLALSGVAVERQGGIAGNPNALGLVSYLGVLGGGLLAGIERKGWRAALLLAATSLPAIGVLLSASRAALLATILTVIGWPVVCGRGRIRHPWVVAAGLLLAWLAFGGYFVRIFESSTMGRRVLRLEEGKDRSGIVRTNLARSALALAIDNPILGVGLGQFGEASGTGMYSHGDWAEVLATTGVPGFFLYIGAMLAVGRRLQRAVRAFRGTGTEDLVRAALLALLVVLATGAVTWPHSLTIHSMFLLGVVFGTAEMVRQGGRVRWARRRDGALPTTAREFARAS